MIFIRLVRLLGVLLGIFILYYVPFQYFRKFDFYTTLTTAQVIGRIFSITLGLLLIIPWSLIADKSRLQRPLYYLLIVASVIVCGFFSLSVLWAIMHDAAGWDALIALMCLTVLIMQLIVINKIEKGSSKD
jgi:hypothetical protein